MKQIKTIILTMLAVLLVLPASARDFEYDGLTYTVIDEEALTCQTKEGGYSIAESQYYSGQVDLYGEVNIPDRAFDGTNYYNVVRIGNYSFARERNITSVVIPETVKTIGVNAFMDCNYLESVVIPESVTSIEPYAFQYTSIREVTLPSSMTEVEDCVFYHCGSLNTINLPESITKIGAYSFFECNSTNRSLKLPSRLETIGDFAFAQSGITSVELPESLVSVGIGAFGDGFEQIIQASSSSLIDLTIPAALKSIGEFAFNKSLYELDVTYYAEKPEPMPLSLFNDETYYRNNKLTMPNANLADILAVSPWNRFSRIIAKDGTLEPVVEEVNFEYNGMTYTVMDAEAKTCRTQEYWWSKNKENVSEDMFADGLEIPSTVSNGTDNYTVVEIGFQTFGACDKLTSIKLPETLKTIRSQAFISCGNLTSIDLPSSLVNIDQEAFRESGLVSITIPENITFIARSTFSGCKNLASVSLPDRLTAIGRYAFFECGKLESFQFPNSLIAISGNAFYPCPISSLRLPDSLEAIGAFNFTCCRDSEIELPEGLKSVGYRSFTTQNLTSLTLPASLKYISTEAFNQNKLKEITYKASKPITALADIFYVEGTESYQYNAYTDARLNMPNATLAAAESALPWGLFDRIYASDGEKDPGLIAGKDFEYDGLVFTVIDPEAKTCRTKKGDLYFGTYTPGNKVSGDVVIPEFAKLGVNDYAVVEIGNFGFAEQPLTSVTIPETVKTIDYCAFEYCPNITSVTLPESVTTLGSAIFGNCESLKNVVLPASLETIGDELFRRSYELTSVTYNAENPLESSWSMFEPDVYENATLYMPNAALETVQSVEPWMDFKKIQAKDGSIGIDKPLVAGDDFEYEGVWYTVIDAEAKTAKTKAGDWNDGVATAGNSYEGDLVIPSTASYGGNDYTVVEISARSFCKNTGITSVSIPESVKAIEVDAFDECRSLTKAQFASIDALCGTFFRGTASNPLYYAHHLYLGEEEVTEIIIPESITEVGHYTFVGGSYLTSVTFHPGITSLGTDAFRDCSGLTSINLPESLTVIGNGSFQECSGLTSIDLPEGVSTIKDYAFMNCGAVTSLTIPASVTSIGTWAFGLLSGLTKVTYNAVTPITCNESIFYTETDLVYENATLYMPNASIADIKATVPWNKFVHINSATQYPDVEISVNPSEGEVSDTNFHVEINFKGVSSVRWAESTYEDGPYPYVVTLEGDPVQNISNFGDSGNTLMLDVSVPDDGSYFVVIPEGSYEFGGEYSGIFGRELMLRYDVKTLSGPPIIDEVTNFEYEGVWYTVLGKEMSLIGKADGSVSCSNIISNRGGTEFVPCQTVSDSERGDVFMCEILPDQENPWDCMLMIKSNETLRSGDQINVSFMYKCTDERSIDTWAFGEPGNYHHYECIGTLNATSEWQHYSWSGTVTDEWEGAEGFLSIGFLLSSKPEAATFYVDDVVFELDRNTCMTREYSFSYDSGNHCTGDLVIPAVVYDGDTEYYVVKIGAQSFYLNGITSVTLPEGVTEIGRRAFGNCSALTSVSIPASLASTEATPFVICTEISEVNYSAESPINLDDDLFPDEVYASATLNTPNATLAAVAAAVPWNKFKMVVASDGEIGFGEPIVEGDQFEYDGIIYTVIDATGRTCSVHGSALGGEIVKVKDSNTVIPEIVSNGVADFTVTEIREWAFTCVDNLLSISLPSTIEKVYENSFYENPRLASVIWRGNRQMINGIIESIDNPNVLVYVDDVLFAPAGLDHNVVADGICENLVLVPDYPFYPAIDFTAEKSSLTREFTQQTPVDGCSGWETIVLPFDVAKVTGPDGKTVIPFAAATDTKRQRPFWLYEGDPAGDWKEAAEMKAGVPYIISMPNNPCYNPAYNISGEVTFANSNPQKITAAKPDTVIWTTGRQFRGLWMPLSTGEAEGALGLNVNATVVENGHEYAPGSAFVAGVTLKPFEAYVTRNGEARAFPIRGAENAVQTLVSDSDGLTITKEGSVVILRSDADRTVDIHSADGTLLRRVTLKAGQAAYVESLPQGILLIVGRKIMVD